MDRLQFDGWYLDGWLTSIQENLAPVRSATSTIVFEVLEGNSRNGDARIWFRPDPNSPMPSLQFQGAIQSLDMETARQVNQIQTLGDWDNGTTQNWGPSRRILTLQIIDVVHENDWGFDPDFARQYMRPLNHTSTRSARPPDPDMERKLAQEQIDRECKLAAEQQEQIDYKNFPNRLDSID